MDGLTMKKTLWWMFDLFIIVCFMLFGMVIADVNEQQIWVGAVGGLLTHRIVSMILVYFRNYIYGGRN
jgi:hypothetical protein